MGYLYVRACVHARWKGRMQRRGWIFNASVSEKMCYPAPDNCHAEKSKRVASSLYPYAVLPAISYKLCIQYCDMIGRSISQSFMFLPFHFSCVHVDTYTRTRA